MSRVVGVPAGAWSRKLREKRKPRGQGSDKHQLVLATIRAKRCEAHAALKMMRAELKNPSRMSWLAMSRDNVSAHIIIALMVVSRFGLASQENRRYKRLMTRAAKLELADLQEVAAVKKWDTEGLTVAATSGETTSGSSSASSSTSSTSSRGSGPTSELDDGTAIVGKDEEPRVEATE